jgi:hypothetical protein
LLNVKAYETLAKLESRNDSNEILGKYVDYHFEASEYEKKLIQVRYEVPVRAQFISTWFRKNHFL